MNPSDVVDNAEARRFELYVGSEVAFIQYADRHGTVALMHTEVPEALEGMGVGSALARGALDLLSERDADVLPFCPFVHDFIRKHHEYLRLVSERYKLRADLEAGTDGGVADA